LSNQNINGIKKRVGLDKKNSRTVEESNGEERVKTVANVLFPAMLSRQILFFQQVVECNEQYKNKKEADFFLKSAPERK